MVREPGSEAQPRPEAAETSAELPHVPESAALARDLVRTALEAQPNPVRELVVLLSDELVVNAILHGAGAVRLRIVVRSRSVVVEVGDDEATGPRLRRPPVDDEHGRGMLLIDSLASEWGTARSPEGGKYVWFRVDLGDDLPDT